MCQGLPVAYRVPDDGWKRGLWAVAPPHRSGVAARARSAARKLHLQRGAVRCAQTVPGAGWTVSGRGGARAAVDRCVRPRSGSAAARARIHLGNRFFFLIFACLSGRIDPRRCFQRSPGQRVTETSLYNNVRAIRRTTGRGRWSAGGDDRPHQQRGSGSEGVASRNGSAYLAQAWGGAGRADRKHRPPKQV